MKKAVMEKKKKKLIQDDAIKKHKQGGDGKMGENVQRE